MSLLSLITARAAYRISRTGEREIRRLSNASQGVCHRLVEFMNQLAGNADEVVTIHRESLREIVTKFNITNESVRNLLNTTDQEIQLTGEDVRILLSNWAELANSANLILNDAYRNTLAGLTLVFLSLCYFAYQKHNETFSDIYNHTTMSELLYIPMSMLVPFALSYLLTLVINAVSPAYDPGELELGGDLLNLIDKIRRPSLSANLQAFYDHPERTHWHHTDLSRLKQELFQRVALEENNIPTNSPAFRYGAEKVFSPDGNLNIFFFAERLNLIECKINVSQRNGNRAVYTFHFRRRNTTDVHWSTASEGTQVDTDAFEGPVISTRGIDDLVEIVNAHVVTQQSAHQAGRTRLTR